MRHVQSVFSRIFAVLCLSLLLTTAGQAQGLRGGTKQATRAPTPVDGIAAVVNKEAITVQEVNQQADRLSMELRSQRLPLPPRERLERQALEMLITERVIQQEAKRMGINVNDQTIDAAIEDIARKNNATVAQIKAQLQRIGMSWASYRRQMARDITLDEVRTALASQIVRPSDAEVDAFLKEQAARKSSGLEPPKRAAPPPPPKPKAQPVPPLIMQLSQIFLSVPEGASPEKVTEVKKRIDDIRARLRRGESFEELAISQSDAPEAVRGGDLGVRPANGWPDLFVRYARNLQPGQISGVFQSPAGFHILKMVRRAGGQQAVPQPPPEPPKPVDPYKMPEGAVMEEQTKARHILIRTTAITNDEAAKARLEAARARIVEGQEPFEQVAKSVSEDASAPQGGDLGWVGKGQTVPAFEAAMDKLQPGEISEPVKSQFGWHLIQVQERRTEDVGDETRRAIARQMLFERRAAAQFDAWMQQMRLQAYIDNRMFRP